MTPRRRPVSAAPRLGVLAAALKAIAAIVLRPRRIGPLTFAAALAAGGLAPRSPASRPGSRPRPPGGQVSRPHGLAGV